MAYPDEQLKRPDPYATQAGGDRRPAAAAPGSRRRIGGLVVAALVVLGLVLAVSLFSGGETPQTAPAGATDTTVPGDGAVDPATGGADDTAPVAPTAPAD
ncbi:hypothetical protein KUV62_10095 [Salipiger bermudensis]|uniref:hypothetical protein n=1 Tax=Salipiger bermudensis TaxID=344736 RepID=UPI001C98FE35|nr:hypothetical protein [Salipiger bermudensis]MBY6004260.1 hypothetical protein [Salipiger bermudensis]